MSRFECDQCGACCRGSLIVEADEIDVLREPRLIAADPHYAALGVAASLELLRSDVGRAVLVACGRACSFLGADHRCAIYPTRPNVCVGLAAGDEQCQLSRGAAGLAPLPPVD